MSEQSRARAISAFAWVGIMVLHPFNCSRFYSPVSVLGGKAVKLCWLEPLWLKVDARWISWSQLKNTERKRCSCEVCCGQIWSFRDGWGRGCSGMILSAEQQVPCVVHLVFWMNVPKNSFLPVWSQSFWYCFGKCTQRWLNRTQQTFESAF